MFQELGIEVTSVNKAPHMSVPWRTTEVAKTEAAQENFSKEVTFELGLDGWEGASHVKFWEERHSFILGREQLQKQFILGLSPIHEAYFTQNLVSNCFLLGGAFCD